MMTHRSPAPAILLSLLLLSACSGGTASVLRDDGTPSDSLEDGAPAADDGQTSPRMIDVTVTAGGFSPNEIRVKQGENVLVRLQSDGAHSFVSADLGLDVAITAGETKGFNIPTENAGAFEFHSTGDAGLTGVIIVE